MAQFREAMLRRLRRTRGGPTMTPRRNGSGISGVRAVELEVADLDRASAFYTSVWGLTLVGSDGPSRWFRGAGAYHHILALHQTGVPAIRRIVLGAAGREIVDRLHGRLGGAPPAALAAPGGGYGLAFKDPEGRCYAVACDVADHAPLADAADRPIKIAHVNVNAVDHRVTASFATEILGFEMIDDTSGLTFFHCDSFDHAAFVVAKDRTGPTLNHIAFELPSLDAVMRGAGRMRDAGYPIEWGVGRHGAGNNVFAYFAGPEEVPLEYTAEIAQVDDSYVPGDPQKWKFPPGRADQWGVTPPQTPRWKRIQEMFHFAG